ncbi:suppressor of tumorigenicity 7 protein-like isoform X2 [Leptonychotes weddellii]|uniref:Suppressor of tumorigenicity 7 protein-like n=1 Tax=Leptonychotes weddellii TaxID=9713 RepID=A0A7F8Q580_LEPWE|nr:suppressor of tumorigenicity 7 protein-like isoform X2 [Leptonychotes weddellii]
MQDITSGILGFVSSPEQSTSWTMKSQNSSPFNRHLLSTYCVPRMVIVTSQHWYSAFHHVSVYPKKELPFFIHFTAGLCSSTAMIALLTHQFPEIMGVFAKALLFRPP